MRPDRGSPPALGRSSARSASVRRRRASGLRRQVPVPVQGASTSTRSKVPARRLTHLSPGSSRWRSTLCTPARRRRRTAPSSRAADTSQATSWPRFCMVIASASVLPPAPAQQVGDAHARPGIDQGGDELAAFVLDLDQAGAEGRPGGDLAAALDAQAPRRSSGVGVASRPSAASAARASSRVAFSRLTRRSSGAGSSRARSSLGLDARHQPVRHFQPDRVGHGRMVERAALADGAAPPAPTAPAARGRSGRR